MPMRIVIHHEAIAELLRGPEIQRDLAARAQRITSAAGGPPDFEHEAHIGKTRARETVRTATVDGMIAEATNRVLTRAIDAGR